MIILFILTLKKLIYLKYLILIKLIIFIIIIKNWLLDFIILKLYYPIISSY